MNKTVIRKEKGVKFELPSEREIFNGILNETFKKYDALEKLNQEQALEIARLKKIAHKMHLYIFLHSDNEQEVYDELGLTDEENAMLGYSGQFILGDKENE